MSPTPSTLPVPPEPQHLGRYRKPGVVLIPVCTPVNESDSPQEAADDLHEDPHPLPRPVGGMLVGGSFGSQETNKQGAGGGQYVVCNPVEESISPLSPRVKALRGFVDGPKRTTSWDQPISELEDLFSGEPMSGPASPMNSHNIALWIESRRNFLIKKNQKMPFLQTLFRYRNSAGPHLKKHKNHNSAAKGVLRGPLKDRASMEGQASMMNSPPCVLYPSIPPISTLKHGTRLG